MDVAYKVITDRLPKGGEVKTFPAKTYEGAKKALIKLAKANLFDPKYSNPLKVLIKKPVDKKAERKPEDEWEVIWEKSQC